MRRLFGLRIFHFFDFLFHQPLFEFFLDDVAMARQRMTVAFQEHVLTGFVPLVDDVNHFLEPQIRPVHDVEIVVKRLDSVFPGGNLVDCLGFLVLDVRVRITEHERAIAPKVVRAIAMAFSLSVVNCYRHS